MAEILNVVLSNLSVSPWVLFYLVNMDSPVILLWQQLVFSFRRLDAQGSERHDMTKVEALPPRLYFHLLPVTPASDLGSPDDFEMLRLSLLHSARAGVRLAILSPFPLLPGRSSC